MKRRMLDDLDQLRASDLPTPNDFTTELGKLIRQAREEKGFTQTELAEKINRSQVRISDIENGKVDISFLTLMLIALSLQKPISYFIPEFIFKSLIVEAKNSQEQEALRLIRHIGMFGEFRVTMEILKTLADYAENEHDRIVNPQDYYEDDE